MRIISEGTLFIKFELDWGGVQETRSSICFVACFAGVLRAASPPMTTTPPVRHGSIGSSGDDENEDEDEYENPLS